MSNQAILLGKSKTGGVSLISIFFLLAGLVCLGMQVVIFLSGRIAEVPGISGFVTGLVGLALLGLFGWTGLRKGEVAVYQDRVEGKSKGGRKYSYPMSELGGIDLRSKLLVLRGKAEKVVLADSPPHDQRLRGLIWLLLNHELPGAVWEKFTEVEEEGLQNAIRQFLNESGEAEFMDRGMIFTVGTRTIYLPVQDTVSAPRQIANEKSLSTSLQVARMVMKFEPNPRDLPLANLASALLAAPLEEKLRLAGFEELVEAHGGTFLQKKDDEWTGETAGWPVKVLPAQGK